MRFPENYRRVQKEFNGVSRTRGSEAAETDINLIVARHAKTGVVTHLNHRPAMFGDLTQATDLKEALDLVLAAQDGFEQLPASVRRAADNSPTKMLELLATPEGTQRLVDAGLDVVVERDPGTPETLPFERPSAAAPASEGSSPQEPS